MQYPLVNHINARNILIIKWGALGDFLAATIAIRALRAQYPSAKITLLSKKNALNICPPGTLVDDFIDFDEVRKERGILGFYKYLKSFRFDVAINLKWSAEGAGLITILVAPISAGSGPWIFRNLYTIKPPRHANDRNRHEYLKNMDIVEALGVPRSTVRPFLHITDADRAFALKYIQKKGFKKGCTIILTPAASSPHKSWPKRRFIELGKRAVAELGAYIIVSWTPSDMDAATDVVAGIGSNACLTPPTTIPQIAAFVEQAAICVCNNSGMLHIAEATLTPSVCFNTSVPWAPFSDISHGINRYSKAYIKENRKTPAKEVQRLLSEISIEEAWRILVTHWRRYVKERCREVDPENWTGCY